MVDDFGARIVKLRKARKLSQRALADRAKALDPNLRLSHSALGNKEETAMKTKEPFAQSLLHKAAQAIVHRELYGWPPESNWGV